VAVSVDALTPMVPKDVELLHNLVEFCKLLFLPPPPADQSDSETAAAVYITDLSEQDVKQLARGLR